MPRCRRSRALPADGQQLDEVAEDFIAVKALKCEGKLGSEQAILDADIETASAQFIGQILFVGGKLRQRRCEMNWTGPLPGQTLGSSLSSSLNFAAKNLHDVRHEHMH